MIDPLLSLAFTMHSNKGGYALLLGSGVSRGAQILTGWEVLLDLIQKLALLQNEKCEPDPETWYARKYGNPPGYADLLDSLAHSQAERNKLLRTYFEPGENDDETAKRPTLVHEAVAELVQAGLVRIILTTNFDRLVETALADAGIAPTVISTADAAKGMLPLQHCDCLLVKLHGDYLDPQIRNTPSELGSYEEPINKLLDRVFDEYGLVVCGWSGTYDTALRAAIERCPSRRFTTYWMLKGTPTDEAQRLIQMRSAQVIRIESADQGFQALAEKVHALADLSAPHPLSTQAAVASLKRNVTDERNRIRLHDLVVAETDRACEIVSRPDLGPQGTYSEEEFRRRIAVYESVTTTLTALIVSGCFWGNQVHWPTWRTIIERLAHHAEFSGLTPWLALRYYPARKLLYAAGLASIAAGRMDTLAELLVKPVTPGHNGVRPVLEALYDNASVWNDLGKVLHQPGPNQVYRVPWSEWLFKRLGEPLHEHLRTDTGYDKAFDRFEYILGLVFACTNKRAWGPVGRFAWKLERLNSDEDLRLLMDQEIQAAGNNWAFLRAGLCGGSLEKLVESKKQYDELVTKIASQWW